MKCDKIVLSGLDGANPLGFLATVGLLKTTKDALNDNYIKIGWSLEHGSWRPILCLSNEMTKEELVTLLDTHLKNVDITPFRFAPDLNISPESFQVQNKLAFEKSNLNNRYFADFLVAYGCESIMDKKNGIILDTALRTMSGAGHQHFLGSMLELIGNTNTDHLFKALFSTWDYSDARPSLRWDPMDDRRYALRWKEPSGDKILTVRGANRLAIEALPLLPTAPYRNGLETTGFSHRPEEGVQFSWPIWKPKITIDIVRSLLSLKELQTLKPDRDTLSRMGIVEVFRSQRITEGKYRNFTSAISV